MDGKLVVSKKKKTVVVEELRQSKYEAFPRGQGAKAKSSDEEMDQDEPGEEGGVEEQDNDAGSRDYDYLLSVRLYCSRQIGTMLTIP